MKRVLWGLFIGSFFLTSPAFASNGASSRHLEGSQPSHRRTIMPLDFNKMHVLLLYKKLQWMLNQGTVRPMLWNVYATKTIDCDVEESAEYKLTLTKALLIILNQLLQGHSDDYLYDKFVALGDEEYDTTRLCKLLDNLKVFGNCGWAVAGVVPANLDKFCQDYPDYSHSLEDALDKVLKKLGSVQKEQ